MANTSYHLISDEPQLVIPGPHSGPRTPEIEIETSLECEFCPRGSPAMRRLAHRPLAG